MKWITRKDIKVDRVACPWLIKKFIDPQAEFLFVEEKDLVEQARIQDAIPFDAPKIEAIKLNHPAEISAHRPRCRCQRPGERGGRGHRFALHCSRLCSNGFIG